MERCITTLRKLLRYIFLNIADMKSYSRGRERGRDCSSASNFTNMAEKSSAFSYLQRIYRMIKRTGKGNLLQIFFVPKPTQKTTRQAAPGSQTKKQNIRKGKHAHKQDGNQLTLNSSITKLPTPLRIQKCILTLSNLSQVSTSITFVPITGHNSPKSSNHLNSNAASSIPLSPIFSLP